VEAQQGLPNVPSLLLYQDVLYTLKEGGLVSRDGYAVVLKAGREWEILAVNALDEECFATPALAEGRIYLRTTKALYAFGQASKVK